MCGVCLFVSLCLNWFVVACDVLSLLIVLLRLLFGLSVVCCLG